ncbi:Metalloreductase steap4 [Basidiobolus ranarum]|uniref:Metalloreductase steap4 n=1 Tax=Basidiobolus ranarum TaxID=34480 RepID=A0ABR2VSU3_9FUNG
MVELSQCVVEQVNNAEKYEVDGVTTIENKVRVAVIGTGWFGRAIAKRLLSNGFDVYLASRNPGKVGFELPCEPTSYTQALTACHIIFLCIPWAAHLTFASEFEELLNIKVVVDIANPGNIHSGTNLGISIAERLQRSLPGAQIVKGFNTISAYSMSNDIKGLNQEVYLCSDYPEALKEVSTLTRTLGYNPVDSGTLSQARNIEAIPLALFEEWRKPTTFTLILLFFFIFYNILSEQLIKNVSWALFPLNNMNSIFASTSMNLFAVANFAGCVANVIQLWTGTAQQQFPQWLASWLNHR